MQVLLIRSYQLLLKGLARVLPFPRQHRLIGAGSSQTLAAELSRRRWRRPLLVSDRQLMQLQLPAALIRDLEATGLPCSVFDQVLENPTIACVEAGLQCYRRNGCDSLIDTALEVHGIGAGSYVLEALTEDDLG